VKDMETGGNYEGDIMLDPVEKAATDKKHNGFASIRGGRWPGARIPYVIDGSIDSRGRQAISQAIASYQAKTCIRFHRRTNERTYIRFYRGRGCSSPVGYYSGRVNSISLATGCWSKGIVIHEIGHSIGLFHEQSRPDRDSYVTIHWNNIIQSTRFNFNKASNIDSLGTKYDVSSIMHYGSRAFSQNGRYTITTKDSSLQNMIGNRRDFSSIDVEQINKMYCGGTKPSSRPVTQPPTGCINKHPSCDSWARSGYCKDSRYIRYMQQNCCLACKGSANCMDKNSSCPSWARSGYCSRNQYVKDNCKKSCKFC